MIYEQYVAKRFKPETMEKVAMAHVIIKEYAEEGYDLTLRQLYYQFVSKGWLANTDRNYQNLGRIVSNARLAGLLPWDSIVDRTRGLEARNHWNGPADLMRDAARSFGVDRWEGQSRRVEVWIEKDALVGVIEGVCRDLDVAYFSCRGYTSQSEMWSAGKRLGEYESSGLSTVILHLGDHDPSGLDMTRDIRDRLHMFHAETEVRRIALTFDQIAEYDPPPNPAKLSDARAEDYVIEHGYESWELDALDPRVMNALIREHVEGLLDMKLFKARKTQEEVSRARLTSVAENWKAHSALIDKKKPRRKK